MEEKIYFADIKDGLVQGFYCKDVHGENIPEGAIAITEDLWQLLLSMGQAEVDMSQLENVTTFNKDGVVVFNMSNAEAFQPHIVEQEPVEHQPSKLELLEEEVKELRAMIENKGV